MRPALQSCLTRLEGLEHRVREEIQATRNFIELLDDCQSVITVGRSDEYESTADCQAALDHLDAAFNDVIPASFATLREHLFMLQPAPHGTSLGTTEGLSESTSTPLSQPSQGLSSGSTSTSANYGPVAQPCLPQPQHSTHSEAFSLTYDPRVTQSLPEGAHSVGRGRVQVPADLPKVDVEQATFTDLLDNDIEMNEVDDVPGYLTESMYLGSVTFQLPKKLKIDNFCIPSKESLVIDPGAVATRVCPRYDGFPRQVFNAKDIEYLRSPTSPLNDVCINGCAALLYSQFKLPTVDCAVFSTHDLPRIRCNSSDETIWRNTSWTRYWEKNVWLLPIHRPSAVGHWVLCIIYVKTQELHLFDSLADTWGSEIKDIMKLIERYLTIARQQHSGVEIDLKGWQTRELNIELCQTNSYDCGLWVLAAMTAVLRGRHVTNLREEQMSDLRQYLCNLVLSVPPQT